MPPINDNFASATLVTGSTGSTTGTLVDATWETGEPRPWSGHDGNNSVWYRWVAPSPGLANFNTSGTTFDTVMQVFTGDSLGSLTLLDMDDDAGDGSASSCIFACETGVTYRIQVVGYDNFETGPITLSWSTHAEPPAPTRPCAAAVGGVPGPPAAHVLPSVDAMLGAADVIGTSSGGSSSLFPWIFTGHPANTVSYAGGIGKTAGGGAVEMAPDGQSLYWWDIIEVRLGVHPDPEFWHSKTVIVRWRHRAQAMSRNSTQPNTYSNTNFYEYTELLTIADFYWGTGQDNTAIPRCIDLRRDEAGNFYWLQWAFNSDIGFPYDDVFVGLKKWSGSGGVTTLTTENPGGSWSFSTRMRIAWNPVHNKLYMVRAVGDQLEFCRVSTSSGAITVEASLAAPEVWTFGSSWGRVRCPCVTPDGSVWVAVGGGDRHAVVRYDPSTGSVTHSMGGGASGTLDTNGDQIGFAAGCVMPKKDSHVVYNVNGFGSLPGVYFITPDLAVTVGTNTYDDVYSTRWASDFRYIGMTWGSMADEQIGSGIGGYGMTHGSTAVLTTPQAPQVSSPCEVGGGHWYQCSAARGYTPSKIERTDYPSGANRQLVRQFPISTGGDGSGKAYYVITGNTLGGAVTLAQKTGAIVRGLAKLGDNLWWVRSQPGDGHGTYLEGGSTASLPITSVTMLLSHPMPNVPDSAPGEIMTIGPLATWNNRLWCVRRRAHFSLPTGWLPGNVMSWDPDFMFNYASGGFVSEILEIDPVGPSVTVRHVETAQVRQLARFATGSGADSPLTVDGLGGLWGMMGTQLWRFDMATHDFVLTSHHASSSAGLVGTPWGSVLYSRENDPFHPGTEMVFELNAVTFVERESPCIKGTGSLLNSGQVVQNEDLGVVAWSAVGNIWELQEFAALTGGWSVG